MLRGFRTELELHHKRHVISVPGGIYFSSVVLSVWDNIHGPKILHVWTGDRVLDEDKKLVTIANFTLNDEAGRSQEGIETKFYSLPKHGVIVTAFVFSLETSKARSEKMKGEKDVFSFFLILPYSEISEYLARHTFCQEKVEKLLDDHFLFHLKKLNSERALLIDKVDKVIIEHFSDQLKRLTELMASIRDHSVPYPIDIKHTFFGNTSDIAKQSPDFLRKAITSHLQTGGYTVVLGQDSESVNSMILTLGLFLTPKEQKTSRLLCPPVAMEGPEGVSVGNFCHYEPGLYLQGYVSVDTNNMPFTKSELEDNCMPSTIINMDKLEVWVFNINLANYIRERSERIRKADEDKKGMGKRLHVQNLSYKDSDMSQYDESAKLLDSVLVRTFLQEVQMLPVNTPGVIESYTSQFIRLINLKALALVKYVEGELKVVENQLYQAGEHIASALTLSAASSSSISKLNTNQLMQNLAIESDGDLRVIVIKAEKIRPKTCMDVLEPLEAAAQVLLQFETL